MAAARSLPYPAQPGADPLAEAVALAEHNKERVLLLRNGEPVAAIVPFEDLERLNNLFDRAEARALTREWEAEGRPRGVSIEVVAGGLGIDLTQDPDPDL